MNPEHVGERRKEWKEYSESSGGVCTGRGQREYLQYHKLSGMG